MTVYQPVRSATLLIPSGPAHDLDRNHLFIILTDSVADLLNGQKESNLLTSVSTLNPALPHDKTCILHKGDHPFISHDSYVSYRDSRILETAKIIKGVETGVLIQKPLMDSGIVDKICDGLSDSPHSPEKIKRFFRMYLKQLSGT